MYRSRTSLRDHTPLSAIDGSSNPFGIFVEYSYEDTNSTPVMFPRGNRNVAAAERIEIPPVYRIFFRTPDGEAIEDSTPNDSKNLFGTLEVKIAEFLKHDTRQTWSLRSIFANYLKYKYPLASHLFENNWRPRAQVYLKNWHRAAYQSRSNSAKRSYFLDRSFERRMNRFRE